MTALDTRTWPRVERRMRLAWPRAQRLSAEEAGYWCERLADLSVEDVEAAVDELAAAPPGPRGAWPPSAPGDLRGPAEESARRRERARREAERHPAPVHERDAEIVSRERAAVWQGIIRDRLAGELREPPVAVLQARYAYAADPVCEWLRGVADERERRGEV